MPMLNGGSDFATIYRPIMQRLWIKIRAVWPLKRVHLSVQGDPLK